MVERLYLSRTVSVRSKAKCSLLQLSHSEYCWIGVRIVSLHELFLDNRLVRGMELEQVPADTLSNVTVKNHTSNNLHDVQ
jgi:hypothetical protein